MKKYIFLIICFSIFYSSPVVGSIYNKGALDTEKGDSIGNCLMKRR